MSRPEEQAGYVLVLPWGTETFPTMAARLDKECRYANSYSRLDVLLDRYYEEMRRAGFRDDWLRVLGDQWTGCDNIAAHKRELRRILPRTVEPALMTPAEWAEYGRLPNVLTVYRGAERGVNERGLSWTLDRDVAARFPFLSRYRAREPVLVTGRVTKQRVVALKLDREERELIIMTGVRIVRVEALPDQGATL